MLIPRGAQLGNYEKRERGKQENREITKRKKHCIAGNLFMI